MSGRTRSLLQGSGAIAIAIVSIFVIVLISVAFFRGVVWFSATFLPWASVASIWAMAICVVVLLPLALFRTTRPWSGLGFVFASYVFGFLCWLLGFIVTTETLGTFWTMIGLFFFGVGIIPLALIGAMVKGFWPLFWMVLITAVLTLGTRLLGFALVATSERPSRALPSDVEQELTNAKGHEQRFSLLRHWVLHPWRGWFASYGLMMLGVGLYTLHLEKTALAFIGAFFIFWSASFVQGLRVTWRKAHWKAMLIVLLLFAAILASAIQKARATGDFATLDSTIIGYLIVFTVYVFAAVITEYIVRWMGRRAS
jgi:hypothetical protein